MIQLKLERFLAIGPNCHGAGDSEEEAVANMRRNWEAHIVGNFTKTRYTLIMGTGLGVDYYGSIFGTSARILKLARPRSFRKLKGGLK